MGPLEPKLRDMQSYKEVVATLEKARQIVDGLRPAIAVVEALVAALKTETNHMNCSVGLPGSYGMQGVLLAIYVDRIAEAVPALRGVSASGRRMLDFKDYSAIGRRTFNYGDIQVMVFFQTENGTGSLKPGTCRWVKVGETTETSPVYKLVCEDTPGEVKPELPLPDEAGT